MDIKRFLTRLSDKVIFPVLIIVIINLFYIAYSSHLKVKNLQSQLLVLNSNVSVRDLDLDHVGKKIPNDLLTVIHFELNIENDLEKEYLILYSVSMNACSPCVEEDINLFRKISSEKDNALVVFILKYKNYREIASLKQRYFIDFPTHFLTFDPAKLDLYQEPSTVLVNKAGKILLQYAVNHRDTERNQLNRQIMQLLLER